VNKKEEGQEPSAEQTRTGQPAAKNAWRKRSLRKEKKKEKKPYKKNKGAKINRLQRQKDGDDRKVEKRRRKQRKKKQRRTDKPLRRK